MSGESSLKHGQDPFCLLCDTQHPVGPCALKAQDLDGNEVLINVLSFPCHGCTALTPKSHSAREWLCRDCVQSAVLAAAHAAQIADGLPEPQRAHFVQWLFDVAFQTCEDMGYQAACAARTTLLRREDVKVVPVVDPKRRNGA